MMKCLAFALANSVAYRRLFLHGGRGYMEDCPMSQRFTGMLLYNIGAGITEIMEEIIAKELHL